MSTLQRLTMGIALALAATTAGAQSGPLSPAPTSVGDAFITLDANGDGALSRSELIRHPELSRSFERMDTDRDGTVSAFEFTSPRNPATGIRPEPFMTRY